jgi:signal transduction histidine kinase
VLFTRSIRRKMAFLLALVLVMLLVSTVSGLTSLRWYYNAIRELNFTVNEMPRRSDLDVAVGGLFKPLLTELPPSVQQREFAKALANVGDELDRFRKKLANVPQTPAILSQRAFSDPVLIGIENELRLVEQIVPHLENDDPKMRSAAVNDLRLHAEILVDRVQAIPDPQSSLAKTIHNAVEGYDTRVSWIVGSGGVVLVLFMFVMRYAYCGIFAPLRQLHRGARRVAQGDFDYRVKLKRVTTDDEIHELADAFNRMTDRFQEITHDLDEQVQQRSQQLVRSERLAGIGFLSAGVAHEINNPLSAIAMAAESLDGRSEELFAELPEADRKLVHQYLSMIQRESFRCQQITRRLLDFARGQEGVNQRFDITGTIIEVLEMVGHMGKYRERNITLRHTGPVYLEGNGPEIKQVVLNLVANSLEAMENGGTLDIGVTEQTDAIVIVFKDDGCGMTEEVITHLFEPFFTKRKGGKGTGLGLSISHRIIADHGGTIEATSEGVGKGSTFRVRLPRRVAAKMAA